MRMIKIRKPMLKLIRPKARNAEHDNHGDAKSDLNS
jgi:hypothetical protein